MSFFKKSARTIAEASYRPGRSATELANAFITSSQNPDDTSALVELTDAVINPNDAYEVLRVIRKKLAGAHGNSGEPYNAAMVLFALCKVPSLSAFRTGIDDKLISALRGRLRSKKPEDMPTRLLVRDGIFYIQAIVSGRVRSETDRDAEAERRQSWRSDPGISKLLSLSRDLPREPTSRARPPPVIRKDSYPRAPPSVREFYERMSESETSAAVLDQVITSHDYRGGLISTNDVFRELFERCKKSQGWLRWFTGLIGPRGNGLKAYGYSGSDIEYAFSTDSCLTAALERAYGAFEHERRRTGRA